MHGLTPMVRRPRKLRGFTLPELLVTAAVIAILALIAIPVLLNAIQNSKQKRTMASIRTLGSAVERYAIDHSLYPLQATCGPAKDNANVKAYTKGKKKKKKGPPDQSETEFSDGWGNPLRYESTDSESYTLCSGGKDGSNCCTPDTPLGPISQYEKDILFYQGSFVTYPEGKQQ